MAGHLVDDRSVPLIFLPPHGTSAASDDLERLSTVGNVGLLRSMSARTVDSLPGVGDGGSEGSGAGGGGGRYYLTPGGPGTTTPGGPGGLGGGEPMAARSTSCPSMACSSGQTIPHGYHPFRTANADNNDDDINLEGEVISDLPIEATRLFPELLPQLGIDLDLVHTAHTAHNRDCDNGNVTNAPYSFAHVHAHQHRHDHPALEPRRISDQDPRVDPAVFSGYPALHSGGQNNHHRTRDYGTNPEILQHAYAHHRDTPVFAQAHSHSHRAVSRSNGHHHGDIPEYNYIRYHRQATKDTDSSADVHRGSYHRQNTKDSGTSMGDGYTGTGSNRRSGRRRSGKHGSTSSSSQRQSTSSQTSGGEYTTPSILTNNGGSSSGGGGNDPKPDRVINIRDLPSSIAREVIAEKSHTDSNFNVDVQEKCMRWLNTLHISTHDP